MVRRSESKFVSKIEESTFTIVQELPVNGIKVDHFFVRVMMGSKVSEKILQKSDRFIH